MLVTVTAGLITVAIAGLIYLSLYLITDKDRYSISYAIGTWVILYSTLMIFGVPSFTGINVLLAALAFVSDVLIGYLGYLFFLRDDKDNSNAYGPN